MRPALPDLDDASAMAVHADALSAVGDPRGELIQLQLAREVSPTDARLARAERDLLARHARVLVGSLHTATSSCQLRWRRGFIVEAQVRSLSRDLFDGHRRRVASPPKLRLARLVRDLLALESAAGLVMLELLMPHSSFACEHLVHAVREVVAARAQALRVLSVQLFEPDDDAAAVDAPTFLASVDEQVGALYVSAARPLAQAVFSLL